jgi:hypothetical protein
MADARKYVANTRIFYISTADGTEKEVKKGDVFDDMDSTSVKNEKEAGNISDFQETAPVPEVK